MCLQGVKLRVPSDGTAWGEKRRRANRYLLQLPVVFSWKDAHGLLRQGQGQTRDLSPCSEYVVAAETPEPGDLVRLEIFLPRITAAVRELRILADGAVIRVEDLPPASTTRGFAVVNYKSILSDHLVPISMKAEWARPARIPPRRQEDVSA